MRQIGDKIEEPSFGFTMEEAKQKIWDYMQMNHELKKADVIIVLGSFDTNVGVYAAKLWLEGLAPILVCSGSGTIHHDNGAYDAFVGSTEAEVFADIARKEGVPNEAIIIENKSQNTGQNYEFSKKLLEADRTTLWAFMDSSPSLTRVTSQKSDSDLKSLKELVK